mgnify:FL=1
MKLERNSRKGQIMIPMASFGDIAFLLIIFFVLVSHFKEANIQVKPPQAVDLSELKPMPRVSVIVDDQGQIWLQGNQIEPGLLENAIKGMIENKNPDQQVVLVKIDKEQQARQFKEVLMAVSRAGGTMALVGREKKN